MLDHPCVGVQGGDSVPCVLHLDDDDTGICGHMRLVMRIYKKLLGLFLANRKGFLFVSFLREIF